MEIWNGEIMPIDLLKRGEYKIDNETEISCLELEVII